MTSLAGLFSILLSLPLAMAAAADTAIPPAPTPPFVKSPPPGSQWSVNIVSTNPVAGNKKAPVSLRIAFGRNGVGHGIVQKQDQSQDQFYAAEGYILQSYQNSPQVAAWKPSGSGDGVDARELRSLSFPGTGWISSRDYAGPEKVEGVDCYRYQRPDSGDAAWIDVATGYPVRTIEGGISYTFSEVDPLPQEVILPPAYQDVLNGIHSQMRALQAMKPNSGS